MALASGTGNGAQWRPYGIPNSMVIAIGFRTEHWLMLKDQFAPHIFSCCIDVRRPFKSRRRREEWAENTAGTGFDALTRDRMKEKDAWGILWEIAVYMLETFGLLIIVCNHGKHRSLSLAYEVSHHTGSKLVSIRKQHDGRQRSVRSFMDDISDRLNWYVSVFGSVHHPLSGIRQCIYPFSGMDWSAQKDPGSQEGSGKYLSMNVGDVVVEIFKDVVESEGWAFGIAIGTGRPEEGWFPPKFVSPLPKFFLPDGEAYPFRDLVVNDASS